jgi:cytochrome c peroxidase
MVSSVRKSVALSASLMCTGVLILAAFQTTPAVAGPAIKGSGLPFSEELAELGDKIFDDKNLSARRNQACNTCHSSSWGFTGPNSAINAGGAVYQGSVAGRFGDRKPPSSAYSTLPPIFAWTHQAGGMFVGGNFWDGRATGEKLGNPAADQAQGPFLNSKEQALRDSACVVYRVSTAVYAPEYKGLWGTGIESIQFPSNIDAMCEDESEPASPIAIDANNRALIENEYNNIAISIAVYEESHNLYSSKFDAMRKGQYKFTAQEQRGLVLFQGKGRCADCHTSTGQRPAFTDHGYNNLGVPKNPDNPFYLTHPDFVDLGLGGFLARRPEWASFAQGELGKMRVPTLRNVDLRPNPSDVKAYMHNGVFKSLEEVVRFYNTRDVLPRCMATNTRADWGELCWPASEVEVNVNTAELGSLGLTRAEEADLVAFLRALSDGYLPDPRGRR